MRKIVIVGGGLAGLMASIQLIRAGIACTVIEKKSYPLHRVCGEYISNEAAPFLKAAGLYPNELKLPQINFLEITSVAGRSARLRLDLGGFGISRYAFDNHLYKIAKREGVNFQLNTEVSSVDLRGDVFEVATQVECYSADLVIGSFGKRSKIDWQQGRPFVKKRSPYVGVKYHIRGQQPSDLISLHNFQGGYCGVCNVEDGVTNLCYLVHRDQVRKFGDIAEMERHVLFNNPKLRAIFTESDFVFNRPEIINEISFETKAPVENHILMAGDAAGMITPVCGNGMAIALHSGKIVSHFAGLFASQKISRLEMEEGYRRAWNKEFLARLWIGRNVQRLFGRPVFSTIAVALADWSKPVAGVIVSKTHGRAF